MKSTLAFIVTASLCAHVSASASTVSFHNGSAVRFATIDEGRAIMGEADGWVRSFSAFDRQLRLRSETPVDENAFLEFARDNVVAWDEAEIDTVTIALNSIARRLERLSMTLDLPDQIVLVQTTGHEEGDVGGYTKGISIIIPESQLKMKRAAFEMFILHELFHVMTRHQPEIREPLYALINFQHSGEIVYPQELMPRKITNPDAYHFDAFVELTAGEEAVKVMPLTLSKSDSYTGGKLFDYVTIEFLEVTVDDAGVHVRYEGDSPVLYQMNEVHGYMEKVGTNTNYIIHAEEIMADNFAMAVLEKDGLPNPEIPAGIIELLATKKR